MDLILTEGWPGLEHRVVRHRRHLFDHEDYPVIQNGGRNLCTLLMVHYGGVSFPAAQFMEARNGQAIMEIYAPFESGVVESQDIAHDVALALFTSSPQVDDITFFEVPFALETGLWENDVITVCTSDSNRQVYQRGLYDPCAYKRRRDKRFAKSGFTVRPLTLADYDAVYGVVSSWVATVGQQLLFDRTGQKLTTTDLDEVENALNGASLGSASKKLFFNMVSKEIFRTELRYPTVTYWGVFAEDRLLAYTSVRALGGFRHLDRAARLHLPGRSALEYLDLTLFEQFARDGVRIVDWGTYLGADEKEGLLRYKQKFGPISLRREYDLYYRREM